MAVVTEGRDEQQISDSFLVRCWMEPRESADEPAVVRLYVRNLRSGEEHYLNDPSQVGELLERSLRQTSGQAASSDLGRRTKAG